MAVLIRGIPVLIVVVLVAFFVYRMGLHLRWWGPIKWRKQRSRPQHAAGSKAAKSVAQQGSEHDKLPATYTLVSMIWQEARVKDHHEWLFTRGDVMIRIYMDGNTLCVERIHSDAYTNRISTGYALVELYTFQQGVDGKSTRCDVKVNRSGPPDFELVFAHEARAAEPDLSTEEKAVDDDTLRRLRVDITMAEKID